jgi:MFS family permease
MERLPIAQLYQISLYWLGINAIWGGLNIALQEIVPPLAPAGEAGRALAALDIFAVLIAVGVQPTVGSISDYTISRWGRRKPYIAIGSVLDVVFLIGIATSQSYLSVFAFVLLLQFSSNFAQGPFQGYIPDLVPAPQVSLASALVGVMSILGVVGGTLVISTGYVLHSFTLPIIALGLIELATAIGTVLWVREGRAPKDRAGRSWWSVAREAWGLDVLRERSFLWLVGSRLFVLAGIAVLSKLAVFYLTRTMGLGESEKAVWVPATLLMIGVVTLVSTIPAARLSDRIGRKSVIYASTTFGMVGAAILALAPNVWIAEGGVVLIAIAAGSFLSVDWALMTDIIPKASSGRYMGISNVATACAGPVALLTGGLLMDVVGGPEEAGSGPRAAMVVAVGLFALGAILLRPVREERVEDVSADGATGYPLRDAVVETEQAVL